MTGWDGNINSPHTMQDEYELARELGVSTLTTDDDGQMIAATCGDELWAGLQCELGANHAGDHRGTATARDGTGHTVPVEWEAD